MGRDMQRTRQYLPRGKARGAHQMPTRLNLDIFVVLCTDLAELEGGAHFTVQFILFLEHREEGTAVNGLLAWSIHMEFPKLRSYLQ